MQGAIMKIGIPREVKNNENRVGLPPNGVSALADNSHDVYVETDAGIGSQFTDEDYKMRAQRSLIALKSMGCRAGHQGQRASS